MLTRRQRDLINTLNTFATQQLDELLPQPPETLFIVLNGQSDRGARYVVGEWLAQCEARTHGASIIVVEASQVDATDLLHATKARLDNNQAVMRRVDLRSLLDYVDRPCMRFRSMHRDKHLRGIGRNTLLLFMQLPDAGDELRPAHGKQVYLVREEQLERLGGLLVGREGHISVQYADKGG